MLRKLWVFIRQASLLMVSLHEDHGPVASEKEPQPGSVDYPECLGGDEEVVVHEAIGDPADILAIHREIMP
jgi:hypothetical protein